VNVTGDTTNEMKADEGDTASKVARHFLASDAKTGIMSDSPSGTMSTIVASVASVIVLHILMAPLS
jgi:hypothetical protein